MGQLINGEWVKTDVREGKKNSKGEFLREPVTFRNQIKKDGRFQPESQRYHLYVSYACPWAHRTLLMRALKDLKEHISVSVVSPLMLEDGWSFKKDFDDIPEDPLFQKEFLREIYLQTDSRFTGKVTVPVLFDKKEEVIVNNESSEIIRMFNTEFDEITGNQEDYYPRDLRPEIDRWNEEIYPKVNNGVYRCGFATSQEAYEEAFDELFECLSKVDQRLQESKYLCGDRLTEADIRLFPTLYRFDPVYHTHFKCNGRLIAQYEGLSRLLKDFLSMEKIRDTIHLDHIKAHYYYSHVSINPSRLIAKGPLIEI